MTWLTRAAVERRSVTILLAVGLFIFGVDRLGQPQAGAPSRRLVPRRDRHRPLPGGRRR